MIRGMMAKYEEAVAGTRMLGERLLHLEFYYHEIEDRSRNPLYELEIPDSYIKDPRDKRDLERDCAVIGKLDEIIYFIDSDIHDKIFVLSKKAEALDGEYGAFNGNSEVNLWSGWIHRAIDDLKKIKALGFSQNILSIHQRYLKGEIKTHQAIGEIHALQLEVDDRFRNFDSSGELSCGRYKELLSHYKKQGDTEGLAKIMDEIHARTYPFGMSYDEFEEMLDFEEAIVGNLEKGLEWDGAKAKESLKKEKTRTPFRQLPEISAWMRSNPETEHMTYKEFCEKFVTDDGREINPGSLKTAWSGQGQYPEGGQEIKRKWDEEERKRTTFTNK